MDTAVDDGDVTVLVVTADRSFAAESEACLSSRSDIVVRTVETVEAAIELLSDGLIDCIVSDHDLPDTDGIAFLQAVRSQEPTLPFVLFTAAGSEAIASRAISADVTEYLIKGQHIDQWERLADLVTDAVAYRREYADLVEPTSRSRTVLEAVDDMIVVIRDDHVEYVNEAGLELLGIDNRRDVSMGFLVRALSRSESDSVETGLEGVLNGTKHLGRLGTTLERDDGTDVSVAVTATYFGWEAEPTVVLVVRDVGDRQERKRELQLKNRVVEKAPVGITIADATAPDYPLLYVNEEFERLTGYPKADALGRNCRFLQGSETDSAAVSEIRSAIERERPVTVELRNYRRDGTEFWNRVTIAPVENDVGEVTHYVGFQEDVTELKERTQRLAQYKRAIDGANELIAAVDDEYRYLFANPAYREFHGIDSGELAGTKLIDGVGREAFANIRPQVEEVLSGESVEFRTTRDLEGKPTRMFDVRYHPLEDETGSIHGIVATLQDLTQQVERETQLATLDRLLRHTIRNELNTIAGRAEVIEKRASQSLGRQAATIRQAATRVLEQAEKEREIIELLTEVPAPRRIDLGALLEETVADVEAEHPRASITYETPENVTLLTIPELERAIEEVLENAIIHDESEEPAVTITVDEQPRTVRITVADTGSGIPSEELAVIRDGEPVEALSHSGGMGLWLAKRILTRSNGTIQFETNEPRGTVVTLVVPRVHSGPEEGSGAAESDR